MRARQGFAVGAALAVALAMALAGCGGGGGGGEVATAGGTPSAGASQVSDQDKALKYVACVRGKGVEIGDPENGVVPAIEKGTVPEADLKAALEACRQYLPTNAKKGTADPGQLEKLRQLAKCMRDNGIADFPDPDPDQGGIGLDPNSGLDVNDPALKAAMQKCNHLVAPSGAPSGGSGGGQGTP